MFGFFKTSPLSFDDFQKAFLQKIIALDPNASSNSRLTILTIEFQKRTFCTVQLYEDYLLRHKDFGDKALDLIFERISTFLETQHEAIPEPDVAHSSVFPVIRHLDYLEGLQEMCGIEHARLFEDVGVSLVFLYRIFAFLPHQTLDGDT